MKLEVNRDTAAGYMIKVQRLPATRKAPPGLPCIVDSGMAKIIFDLGHESRLAVVTMKDNGAGLH